VNEVHRRAFGPNSIHLEEHPVAIGAEHRTQLREFAGRHSEAEVVNARPMGAQELADRRGGVVSLEQLDAREWGAHVDQLDLKMF